jgi:carboxymethylenebutenolidase
MKKISDGGWDYEVFGGDSNVGVVLVHEIYGLDDYVRDVARELSGKGFTVAAVDLYHGRYDSNLEKSFALRNSVTRPVLLDCMGRGLELLKREIKSDKVVVGSMGFCMGGGFALYSSCHLGFGFTVVYYGAVEEAEELKGIGGPILLIEGLDSERDMTWVRDMFVPSIIKYKKRTDMHFYPNAGHAFHRPGTGRHNPEATKDAWVKTVEFISQFRRRPS